MRKKRKIDNGMTSEEIFLQKLSEERYKERSLILKLEVFPTHGGMKGHKISYVPANCLIIPERQLLDEFGPGRFFLRLVDGNHKPLEEHGCLWLDLGNSDENGQVLDFIDFEIDNARRNLKKMCSDLGVAYPSGERGIERAEKIAEGLQGVANLYSALRNRHGEP